MQQVISCDIFSSEQQEMNAAIALHIWQFGLFVEQVDPIMQCTESQFIIHSFRLSSVWIFISRFFVIMKWAICLLWAITVTANSIYIYISNYLVIDNQYYLIARIDLFPIQWNLSVTTTSLIKYITRDLVSNLF